MLGEIRSNVVTASIPMPPVRVFGHAVHNYRFVPESYLVAVGLQWDPGLDELVYLRMLIEEDTEDLVQ